MVDGSAVRPGGSPAQRTIRRRTWPGTSSPTSTARGWSCPRRAIGTPTRIAGAAGPSSISASSTSGSSPWTRCASRSSASTRDATWLPPGIGLEERELDWLRNMSDWMISKKRYYGLALPIWECTDCDAWEVIGRKTSFASARRPAGTSSTATARIGRGSTLWRSRASSCGGRARARRRRQSVARRRHRRPLDAGLELGPRRVGEVVPGRLDQRGVPGAVPQLVLRTADDVDGDDRPRAVQDVFATRYARRARRGDAQEQGQRDLVRRRRRATSAPTSCAGCSRPRTRRRT